MIDRLTGLLAFAVVFSALISGQPASAQTTDAQRVIRAQEDAISRGDGVEAYSYASPAVQGMFRNPDIFMSMVRQGYAPLVRPRSFDFGEAKQSGDNVEQLVDIVDNNGTNWQARYTLEKQPDGSFKITSCSLLKTGQSV